MTLPGCALQQAADLMLRSWLLELPLAGSVLPGGAQRCELRVIGVKFMKLDGVITIDGYTEDDLMGLEIEELLISVPATCMPYDAGSPAAVDYVSVTLR